MLFQQMPAKYVPKHIKEWDVDEEVEVNGASGWIPARPMSFRALRILYRLKMAWLVFIGRYDVLDWSAETTYKYDQKKIEQAKLREFGNAYFPQKVLSPDEAGLVTIGLRDPGIS
jgi:hypothetical protein